MRLRRFSPWILLLVATTWLSGCFGDALQSTIQPESDSARVIQDVYALVTYITFAILIFVTVLLLYAIWRYRDRGQKEIPKQTHGNTAMELVWTVIPAVILIFIAVPTWSAIFRAAAPPAENAIIVEAVGHQWWWEFKYPEQGVTTANEFHVPLGRSVVVNTHSVDVIHSFWLPRLAGKIDSLPGKQNTIWFTPEKTGVYYGQCAEFCGTSHANMRFRVVVQTQEEFDAWVAKASQPPVPETADALAGEQLFQEKLCITCHTISGVPGAVGVLGPNLNNLGERSSLASAIMENTPENLAAWIHDPQSLKPGALMILPLPVSAVEAQQIAAYLTSPAGERDFSARNQGMDAIAAVGGGEGGGLDAKSIITAKACGACHVIPGVPGAVGTIGPSLDGLSGRATIAAGTIEKNDENLKKWLANPPAMKPGTQMPNLALTEAEIDALVEFLNTL